MPQLTLIQSAANIIIITCKEEEIFSLSTSLGKLDAQRKYTSATTDCPTEIILMLPRKCLALSLLFYQLLANESYEMKSYVMNSLY